MTAAYQQFDGLSSGDQLRWILRFANLRTLPQGPKGNALGYELRALAAVVGLGWTWRHAHRPLPVRDIMEIHRALHTGIERVKSSSVTDNSKGWQLPRHRTFLSRLPPPPENPKARMPIVEMYEAANEVSAIVAAFGHFLRRYSAQWRLCPCGCGESFVIKGKQMYLNPQHENRDNHRVHPGRARDTRKASQQ